MNMTQNGGIDILVHIVGGSFAPSGGNAALSDDDWQRALDGNLLAAVRLDRALLPNMLQKGSGVIVHVSSIQRRMPAGDLGHRLTARAARAQVRGLDRGPTTPDVVVRREPRHVACGDVSAKTSVAPTAGRNEWAG